MSKRNCLTKKIGAKIYSKKTPKIPIGAVKTIFEKKNAKNIGYSKILHV